MTDNYNVRGYSTADKIMSAEESAHIITRTLEHFKGNREDIAVSLIEWWQSETRWARNRVSLSSDRRDIQLSIGVKVRGRWGNSTTNQIDDLSLKGLIEVAERSADMMSGREALIVKTLTPQLPIPKTSSWSENTYNTDREKNAALIANLYKESESNGLLSAGYLEFRGFANSQINPLSSTPNKIVRAQHSQAQCSATVRHAKGVGSGWAGAANFDWNKIDAHGLSAIALDKCIKSINPVAIEPGRYTVILEPQAASEIIAPLVVWLNMRERAENGQGPFALAQDPALGLIRTKLGLKVIDERISIYHDPSHTDLGIVPSEGMRPVTWVKDGVLTAMSYDRNRYGVPALNFNTADFPRPSFSMSGGNASLSDMISDTKRGILVTRFWGISSVDENSVLVTGLTRDGLWLVENGKVSKAIKNFRFTESPMFMLNQIEALGMPVSVFRPTINPYSSFLSPALIPAVKARDFSFTSLVDAV